MDVRDGPLDTRVRDIVHSKSALLESGGAVLTTEPSATVFDCIGRMVDRDVGSIVVMAGEEIAGIFTERHYMRSIALKGRSSKETEVREVMSSDVTTVQPDRNLEECLHLMTELRCRHLPVVGDNDELVGLVSIGDCVKRILDTAHQEIDRLRRFTEGGYPS
jgi:CBS domain-containing protein